MEKNILFPKKIIFVANGFIRTKFGPKNCFSVQIGAFNLAINNRKMFTDKVISKKKGRQSYCDTE